MEEGCVYSVLNRGPVTSRHGIMQNGTGRGVRCLRNDGKDFSFSMDGVAVEVRTYSQRHWWFPLVGCEFAFSQ